MRGRATVPRATQHPHDDDSDRAVRAAIRMLQELRKFNERRLARRPKPVDMSVSTPPNTIVFGTGRVPLTRMIRAGALLDVACILVVWTGVLLLRPWLPRAG